MTHPEIAGQTVPDEESIAFEIAAVAAVTAGAVSAVAGPVALALAAYAAGARGLELGQALAARLRFVRWARMAPGLRRVAEDARALGMRRALRDHGRPVRVSTPDPPDLPDPDRALSDAVESAARLAELLGMETKRDLLSVQGRVNQGVARAKGQTRWTANEGINAGTAEVARAAGQRLIWVAERNACLHCLAHAGWAVEPGEDFPGLSFDPVRPNTFGPVPWPPLHPNCRCQVRLYSGEAGAPTTDRSSLDPAGRLAAEARRSVVYQWSDFASGVRAREAAGRLLEIGANLPTSVESRASRALRSGRTVKRPE